MKQYLDILRDVYVNGYDQPNRTATNARKTFGHQFKHDMRNGFPLLTTKKIHFKSVVYELLWFLKGDTNIKYLNDHGITIWDAWADEFGDLGPVYGSQWRDFNGCDQLTEVLKILVKSPYSRRMLVSAWNPDSLPYDDLTFAENVRALRQALPPCHYSWQLSVQDGYLDLLWTQRSVDAFLGLPFNIASYGLLLSMIAQCYGYKPRYLIGSLGDTHIYHNHLTQVEIQLERPPQKLPGMSIRTAVSLLDLDYEDIFLDSYHPLKHIPGKISV